jgi:hypothetical protein
VRPGHFRDDHGRRRRRTAASDNGRRGGDGHAWLRDDEALLSEDGTSRFAEGESVEVQNYR